MQTAVVGASVAGTETTHSPGTFAYSAQPPWIGREATRSPTLTPSISEPRDSTRPTTSQPGTCGVAARSGCRPWQTSKSAKLIPAASTRTRTSPGPGGGTSHGRTSNACGPPCRVNTTAVPVSGFGTATGVAGCCLMTDFSTAVITSSRVALGMLVDTPSSAVEIAGQLPGAEALVVVDVVAPPVREPFLAGLQKPEHGAGEGDHQGAGQRDGRRTQFGDPEPEKVVERRNSRAIPKEQPEADFHHEGEDPGPQPAADVGDPVDGQRQDREAGDGAGLTLVGRHPAGEPVVDGRAGPPHEAPELPPEGDAGDQGGDDGETAEYRPHEPTGAAYRVALIGHECPLHARRVVPEARRFAGLGQRRSEVRL